MVSGAGSLNRGIRLPTPKALVRICVWRMAGISEELGIHRKALSWAPGQRVGGGPPENVFRSSVLLSAPLRLQWGTGAS